MLRYYSMDGRTVETKKADGKGAEVEVSEKMQEDIDSQFEQTVKRAVAPLVRLLLPQMERPAQGRAGYDRGDRENHPGRC